VIQAVIFDIDGTLVDSVDLHAVCWQHALAHFGIDVPFAEVRGQIGTGGDQLLPVFVPGQVLARKGEEIERFRSDLFKRDYLSKVRAFPRVRELFERVRGEGLHIVLASSAKSDELGHYKRIARIEDLVDSEVSGDDVAHSKPCPDIYHAALRPLAPMPARRSRSATHRTTPRLRAVRVSAPSGSCREAFAKRTCAGPGASPFTTRRPISWTISPVHRWERRGPRPDGRRPPL
jgi:beta-phosphoglucomutase-like phosphatase (HAD superfamily)